MSWWSAADELLLITFWLLAPGTAFLWAVGVRGLQAVLVAPAVSVGGLAGLAIAFGAAGIPWNWVTALAGCAVVSLLTWAVRRVGSPVAPVQPPHAREATRMRRFKGRRARDVRLAQALAISGVVIGGLVAAVPIMRGMTAPDLLPQASDTVFHLNAVRFVLDTGNASSLNLNHMVNQSTGSGFYPAAWHGLAALGTTSSVVVSSNALVLVLVGLVWPFSLAAVAVITAPGRKTVALFAPVLGSTFIAFPTQLFSWGALWPNALAFALVPAALACMAKVFRAESTDQRVAWMLATIAAVGGIGLAQPNGVLTFALAATPLVLSHVIGTVRRTVSSGRRAIAALAAASGIAWCAAALVSLTVMNGQVRTLHRGWYSGFWTGMWQALTDAVPDTDELAPALGELLIFPGSRFVTALVVAGTFCLVFRRESRWLIGSLALLAVFAGLADDPTHFTWTDAWFSDLFRLRAAVPIASALVMAHALDFGTTIAARGISHVLSPRWAQRAVLPACAMLALVAMVIITGGMRADLREEVLRNRYVTLAVEGRGARTTPDEQQMMARLDDELSSGGVLLGNPANGSPLAFAIADVPVVFPFDSGQWSADARLVAERFDQLHEDPAVCEALTRLGVRYFYADPDVPSWAGQGPYAGLPGDAPQPGFDLVDQGGTARVYRMTACD